MDPRRPKSNKKATFAPDWDERPNQNEEQRLPKLETQPPPPPPLPDFFKNAGQSESEQQTEERMPPIKAQRKPFVALKELPAEQGQVIEALPKIVRFSNDNAQSSKLHLFRSLNAIITN